MSIVLQRSAGNNRLQADVISVPGDFLSSVNKKKNISPTSKCLRYSRSSEQIDPVSHDVTAKCVADVLTTFYA